MKNTTSEPEDSIFRKKGFFIALYSCLGAVAILALVITISNFGPSGFQAGDYDEDAAPVGADQVEPYLSQVDEEAWFRPRQTPTPPPAPTPVPRPTPEPRHTPHPSMPTMPEPDSGIPPGPTPPPSAEVEEPEPAAEAEEPLPPPAPVTFEPFAEGSRMVWPVVGDIAMRFSLDSMVFDPTLVQFRTNDDLRISSEAGAHVQAGADGRVLAIGRNVVRGNYVKIDHGNGLIATYGQLADNKLVSVGDIVWAGQLIGTVGSPSIFGSMLGYHVNMHVTRDGAPVNPYELLVARVD